MPGLEPGEDRDPPENGDGEAGRGGAEPNPGEGLGAGRVTLGAGLGAGRGGAAAGRGAAGAAAGRGAAGAAAGLGAAGAAGGLGAAGAAAGFVAAGFAAAGFRAVDLRAAARLGAARLVFFTVALRAGFFALTDLPRRAAPARRALVLAPALRLVVARFPAFFLVRVVFDFDFDLRAALAITSSCFPLSGFITRRGEACAIAAAVPPTHARYLKSECKPPAHPFCCRERRSACGCGPPVAQSSSSTVWTIGMSVTNPSCVIQPR